MWLSLSCLKLYFVILIPTKLHKGKTDLEIDDGGVRLELGGTVAALQSVEVELQDPARKLCECSSARSTLFTPYSILDRN